jgi:ABC-2 type transport system ATP-binding protein
MRTDAALELREITKTYHVFPVVRAVSFVARPGEVIGYLGPNGAGKTTTIKMLAGLLDPSEGSILFGGRDIRRDPYAYKKRIGYVPEQSELYPHLSGQDYLFLVGRLRMIPESVLRDKVRGFLELFGLDEDKHSSLASYSKGMRQKILISAALLHDPDVLLFDEPLSGLDVTTALVVRDLVKRLAAAGKIVIYSSHVLEVTEKICSRVIIIHKGSIVADDSVEGLRRLMNLNGLAEIFSQLVVHEDTELVARRLVEIMMRT